jgi:hypothetical protein
VGFVGEGVGDGERVGWVCCEDVRGEGGGGGERGSGVCFGGDGVAVVVGERGGGVCLGGFGFFVGA